MAYTVKTTTNSRATVLIAVILAVGALYVGRHVLIPIALAALLSFLLSPLVSRAQRLGLRRIPAVIVVVVLALSVAVSTAWLVASQASGLAGELPGYRRNIVEKGRTVRASLGGSFGEASKTIKEISKEIAATPNSQPATAHPHSPGAAGDPVIDASIESPEINPTNVMRRLLNWGEAVGPFEFTRAEKTEPRPLPVRVEPRERSIVQWLQFAFEPFLAPVANVGIATVFVVFMLVQREELRDRLIRLIGSGRMYVTTEALNDAGQRVSRYLIMQVLINLLVGTTIAAGLALIGLPGAILWGLTAALLRFVPFVGAWIAAAMPILLALAAFDDWVRPLMVAGLFLSVDLAYASILEPWIYGAHTGASPCAILVSMVFWTWLWGGAGLFLATPLTVCLVVIGRYVPQLEFLSVLLSDQPALPLHVRFYQRLLAMDEPGVGEMARQSLKQMPLVELCDRVVIPALHALERDRRHGVLGSHREAVVREAVGRLFEDLGDLQGNAPAGTGEPDAVDRRHTALHDPACVWCVPARTRLDELTAQMLAQVLEADGLRTRVYSATSLPAEPAEALRQSASPVVCVCALSPSSMGAVQQISKRLLNQVPRLNLLPAIWAGVSARPGMAGIPGRENVELITRMSEALRLIRLAVGADCRNEACACTPLHPAEIAEPSASAAGPSFRL